MNSTNSQLPTREGEIINSLNSFLGTLLHKVIKGKGNFSDLLVAIAVVSVLYLIYLPEAGVNQLNFSTLTAYNWLALISFASSTLFFLIFVRRIVIRETMRTLDWVRGLRPRVYQLDGLLVSSQEAVGKNVGKAFDLPIRIKEFYEMSFEVQVLDLKEHWRAGVKLKHPNENEGRYIFHAHVDENTPTVLRVRGNYIISGAEAKDERREVQSLSKDAFDLKLSNENGFVKSYINNKEVFNFEISESIMSRVSLHAWADGKPYKILFKDIKVKYR